MLAALTRIDDEQVTADLAGPRAVAPPPIPLMPERTVQRYATRGFNWPVIATVAALHVGTIALLVQLDVVRFEARKAPLVVELVRLPVDPPPEAPPPESVKLEPRVTKPVETIVAPPPVVRLAAAPPPPVVTAPAAPPPPAVVVAPPSPRQALATGAVSAGDLSAKMISAKPPRYPMESRRKREEGTVVLAVVLSISGTVTDVAVSRSSGFARLDKAALDAVRRWRWSPTMLNGEAVMVKGIVEIPFLLQG